MDTTILLDDIIFITLSDNLVIENTDFNFDKSIPIPVQLPDGKKEIDLKEGIKFEMIGSALIRVVAHLSDHPHSAYYRSMLISLQPDIVHELQVAAIAKANNGDLDFAEELFLAASYLSPNIPELFVNLSVLYGQKAKEALDKGEKELYDEAVTKQANVLRRGLTANPLSELLLSESGLVNLFLGNNEIAYEQLKLYLELAPPSEKKSLIEKQFETLALSVESDQTLQEAFDEMQLGNVEQALRLINSYIENNKDSWSGYFIKGWALRRLEEYDEARNAFLKCLSLGEQNADIYNELAICALEMKQRGLAKEYLSIALELEEDNVKIISNLAFLELQDENYEEAKELLYKGEQYDENDPALKHLKEELDKRGYLEEEDDDIIDL